MLPTAAEATPTRRAMVDVADGGRRQPPWGAAASLGLHIALMLVVLLWPAAKPWPKPAEKSVSVEILSPNQMPAAVEKPKSPAVLASPSPAIPDPDPKAAIPEPSGMIRATRMLSAKTLADPRSRKVRADLATFSDSERVVQLCNLEAMDQIEAWQPQFRPQNLVAYARSNERMTANRIEAGGAAFRSRQDWYDLTFSCEVAPSHDKVVAFAFKVGSKVPRDLWDELGLWGGEEKSDE